MAGSLKRYKAVAFLGSLLMFLLELLAAKSLLPLFGGGAYVWTMALMFFQGLLFFGYGRMICAGGPALRWLHLSIVVAAVAASALHLAAPSFGAAFVDLLLALAFKAGLPFLVLSATTPIIQEWLRLEGCDDPSFLFAHSNAGAFAALLLYPLLIEPNVPLEWQARFVSLGLGLYAALLAMCSPGSAGPQNAPPTPRKEGWREIMLWLMLSLGPNAVLLSATNLLGMDLAAVPLIWVIPLAVYLATLVLAFKSKAWLPDRPAWLLIGAGLVILMGTAYGLAALRHSPESWFVERQFISLLSGEKRQGILRQL